MEKAPSPWNVPVAVEEIPATGLHVELTPPEATRDELAKFAGIRDLLRLNAVFDLDRRGSAVQVRGRVAALVGQTCVVTLEPIESAIDEPVDVTFAPLPSSGEAGDTPGAGHHAETDDAEAPEPLVGGVLDLGALATEFLVLGVEPYPRKPGVTFTPPKAEDDGGHPFSALAALKNRPGGGKA